MVTFHLCGRQIKKGEHYFFMERMDERWNPFTSDYNDDDPLRQCREFEHRQPYPSDVIRRMCMDCAVRNGHIW